jgi:hypothetical protein
MATALQTRPTIGRQDSHWPVVVSGWSSRRHSFTLVELAMMAAIGAVVAYLLVVALWLRVDYYDSYLSLLNAGAIAHGEGWLYSTLRPILYPALLTPIVVVVERFSASPLTEFVVSHFFAVIMFALFLLASFKVFRMHLSRPWALVGVLAISWNVVLLSQAPLAKEDIPGALFTTAGFFFYLRGRQTGRWRYFLAAGVMVAGVMGTRYQLAALPFAVIMSFELISRISRARLSIWSWPAVRMHAIKLLTLFTVAAGLFLLIPVAVYPLVHRATAFGAPQQLFNDILAMYVLAQGIAPEPPIINFRFMVESMTWPLLFCAVLGVVASFRSRQPGALFHLLWFVVFFGVGTFVVVHKEARYLIALLPPLYFFVARGLQAISGWALTHPRVPAQWGARAGAIVAALLLVVPAGNAVAAGARFTDPVYTSDYEAQVSRYAEVLAGPGHITWLGPAYPLHPHDYVFDRADQFTYIYHYYAFETLFWTGRWVYPLAGYGAVITQPGAAPFVYPGIANVLKDGDVVIVNLARTGYDTASLPHSLPPLVVEQVHTQRFSSSSGQAAGPWVFTSPTMPGSIRVREQAANYLVEGAGLPDGQFELYTPETSSVLLHSMALVSVHAGSFRIAVPIDSWPSKRPGASLVLLYYGSVLPFSPPGS